ncbi:hypothetical protein HDV06_003457 [Boothiomyces sp. JEL0866]|nr:hypothetical protein HDV06_003457 [Boothiomyces sp. JEL0866]
MIGIQTKTVFKIVGFAVCLWAAASMLLKVDYPLFIMSNSSGDPPITTTDLLFLHRVRQLRIGDLIIFRISEGSNVPICHRIIELHQETALGGWKVLTKGDYNAVDDRGLYESGQVWIEPSNVIGVVYAKIPLLGYLKVLWKNDFVDLWSLIQLIYDQLHLSVYLKVF